GDKGVSLEYQAITDLEIPFIPFPTSRLQRKFTRHTIPSLLRLPKGFFTALFIIKKHKPDVILSFGGYIALPICFAAFLQKIPIVIHEQTFGAGLTNKLTASFAKKVCISWETSLPFFPKNKTVLTGNPIYKGEVSKDIATVLPENKTLPLVVIVGGSSGSHAINCFIEESLQKLLEKVAIVHQTGDAKEFGDFDRLVRVANAFPKRLQERYKPVRFIAPDSIFPLFEKADIIVGRSGINTVLTLLILQKPSLLIPLPISQQQEQLQNAQFLQKAGLAKILSQAVLTPEKLYEEIIDMVQKKNTYKTIFNDTTAQLHLNSAQKIATIVYETAHSNS
ncbi:MAG: UDP-N-acetylglucosamine--N-acetylmuramyl-(pentapeptide) pyrophosphoryl-undecaprenol N-acetylglucosamine transferase, partial [Candidatus Levyibacteriota bacterium]